MRKSRLRAQSPAQQQTASRPGTRAKKGAKSLAREEEKENIGRQTTVSRSHRRSGVLGATTTSGISSTATKPVAKGVRKGKPLQVKEKKQPLQDITSQYLPAPESANRGAGSEGGEYTVPLQDLSYPITVPTPRLPNLLLSPLPPSSPPPDLVLPSVKPSEDSADGHLYDQPDNPSFSDNKYNTENDQQTSSSSDPFGFTALERKLKEERKSVTQVFDTHEDEDIYEELDEILVADTSSPRPVGRIKRSLSHIKEERQYSEIEVQDDAIEGAPIPLVHPHVSTPPTPRKGKSVHRRLSCEGRDVFSPCPSSLESSPSPTKSSANKRRRDLLYGQDPLEEFNTAVDESGCADVVIDKPPSKRQCQVSRKQDDGHHNTITWNLRPRRAAAAVTAETEKAHTVSKPVKEVSRAKPNKKVKSNSSKKVPDAFTDDDLDEVSSKRTGYEAFSFVE